MPMNRKLYPSNWRTIALIVKTLAGWECQNCGRPCLEPEQDWFDFVHDLARTQSKWYDETFEEKNGGYVEKKGRFVLTVAHLDHDPENPEPRLKALCPACHNKHDAPNRARNAKKTRHKKKHRGQLKLF